MFTKLKTHIKSRDLLFLFIGALTATVANNWTYFTFDREINISDLFTAILAGYLGLYIAGKLTSQVSSERIEKDILIQDLPLIRNNLTRIHSQLESGNVVFNEVLPMMKACSQSLNDLIDTVGICKPELANELQLANLLTRVRALNHILTSYPTTPTGLFNIPIQDYPDLKSKTRVLYNDFTKIVFDINRF
jgi:hypothetical protein